MSKGFVWLLVLVLVGGLAYYLYTSTGMFGGKGSLLETQTTTTPTGDQAVIKY